MDYTVILSPKAVGDLEKIVRYIALNNPEAARKVGQNLLEKTKELSQFPFKGQKVLEFNDADIRQIVLKPSIDLLSIDSVKAMTDWNYDRF
jgi:toxin ParE1/3/4